MNTATTLNILNNDLIISANKVDIQGNISSNTQDVTIQPTTAGHAINLGSATDAAANTVELSDAELDRISAGLLTIGSTNAGAMTLSADISAATPTTVHLRSGSGITATAGGIVETNLAITAGGTVNFSDTTTDVDNLAISAAGQTVDFLDADDLDIDTVAGITGLTAGTAHLRGTTITDAQRILATNLAITSTGTVTLDAASNDVDDLAISAAGQTVTFTDADGVDIDTVSGVTGISAATFNLNTGGAVTDASASTVTGTITIAAGAGNNITLDVATNDFTTVAITSGKNVNLSDQNAITLNASTVSGTLDMVSEGITIAGNITTNGTTTIDADRNNAGTGNFTIDATRTLDTSDSDLTIFANDLILDGSLDAGSASLTLEVSDGGTMGLGNGAGDFAISNAELGRMTADDFAFGGTTTGVMTVDSVNVGDVSLNAGANGADIVFSGASSIFDTLLASANDGINVNADLTTDVGDLTLNADGDSAADAIDAVNLANGTDINSAGDLSFGNTANSGTLAGTISLTAADDITIANKLGGGATLSITSTTGDINITGNIGAATPLTSLVLDGADLSGEIHADAISITGNSATLTGTVMGGNNQAAASAITFIGAVGAGPYLMNGFSIFYTPPSSSSSSGTIIPGGAPGRSTTNQLASTIGGSAVFTQIPAVQIGGDFMTAQNMRETEGLRNAPGDVMIQNMSQNQFIPNIFEHDFMLVKISEELRETFKIYESQNFDF